MKPAIILLSALFIASGCSNAQSDAVNKYRLDTLQRPSFLSSNAHLLNFGSEEEPIIVWFDYLGSLEKGEDKYTHIVGIQYYYVSAAKKDTLYYESFELRNEEKQINFKNYKILNYPGDATIKVSNGKDSLFLFVVLESNEFARKHRGSIFKRMPTVSKKDNQYISDVEMEFELRETSNGMFELTLNDGTKLKYQINKDCKIKNQIVSFLDRENGRIYFIDKNCYLDLIHKSDVKNFHRIR